LAEYAFVTTWRIEAPIEKVWDAIYHADRWPSWWKGVESVVKVAAGDDQGVGSIRRYTWKSRLPYRLVFEMRTTRVEKPVALEGEATGELTGTGRWQLSQDGGITTARYFWNVRTTQAWMNLLAPLARPIFAWNHDIVMRQGGQGLARLLGVRLIEGA
jgi:uncharacterized protein YndB with AHSA1/START domain